MLFPNVNSSSLDIKSISLTYTEMIVSGISNILNISFKTSKEYIQYAKENNLISEKDYDDYKNDKDVSKIAAVNFLYALLPDDEIQFTESPFTDISSLNLNYLYYSLIIDASLTKFYPNDKIMKMTWLRWLNNTKNYLDNPLMFVSNQMKIFPLSNKRNFNFGYIEVIDDSFNESIYMMFEKGFLFEAQEITFSIDTTDSEVLKSSLQNNWLIFNRSNGELTSGTKIDVNIEYGKDTRVTINFIYPEDYFSNRDIVVNGVYSLINSKKFEKYPRRIQIDKVFSYIINNVSYANEMKDEFKYAYGALIDRTAVCSGYTDLFSIFMRELGIPNIRVQGTYKEIPHTWNVIYVDNRWLYVDSTLSSKDVRLVSENDLEFHIYDKKLLEQLKIII